MTESLPSSTESDSPDTAPGADEAILTEAQLAEAKQYNRISFRCDLLDRAMDIVFLAIMAFVFSVSLDRSLQRVDWLANDSLRLIVLYLIVTLLHLLISFPLSYYSGHVLEHRFELSRQTFLGWLKRYAKRHSLTLAFGSLITLGLYWIIWTTGASWWLVAAGAYFGLSILLGQLAPVLILPLFYKIERLDDDTLNDRLTRISEGTGLSIEGVYRMQMSEETAKANAMLAGLGGTRRVILGDTLLDGFDPEEIDVIFAHEIGHHVHHHVPKLILSGLLYSVVGFFLCDQALRAWVQHVDGAIIYQQLPVYTVPLLTLVTTLFFMIVEPLQNAISRHFERQADTYALRRTQLGSAYRSAFNKLARLNKADPDPHRWEVMLFHSHPPISARLALAERILPSTPDVPHPGA